MGEWGTCREGLEESHFLGGEKDESERRRGEGKSVGSGVGREKKKAQLLTDELGQG